MTKRLRTILFIICVILFLIATPLIVLYSQGYRFDFESRKIVRTGALYFKVWPRNTSIYIDGKFKKMTNIIFGEAFIENLLPKTYNVQVKKQGFHDWEKNLQIEETKVAELKNVFLVPENPVFSQLIDDIDLFWSSNDGKRMILKDTQDDGWILKMLNLDNKTTSNLIKEVDLKERQENEVEITDLEFSPDSERILLKIKESEKEKYLVLRLEEAIFDLISPNLNNEKIKEAYFHPQEQNNLFLSTESDLFEYSLLNKELNPVLKDLIAYRISDQGIVFLSSEGLFFNSDFSGQIQIRLNQEPFPLNNEAEYQIQVKGKKIFLLEDKCLYLFNQNSNELEKIGEEVEKFEISPDGDKIFFYSNNEIWIFFLKEITEQPIKKEGEKLFLTRFSEKIGKVFWYNPYYLIFEVGSKIKIAEIDDRDRINIVDLAEFTTPQIFFNSQDKKLYIFSERTLFVSGKLLP